MTPGGRPPKPEGERRTKLWAYVTQAEKNEIVTAYEQARPEETKFGRWIAEIILSTIRKK